MRTGARNSFGNSTSRNRAVRERRRPPQLIRQRLAFYLSVHRQAPRRKHGAKLRIHNALLRVYTIDAVKYRAYIREAKYAPFSTLWVLFRFPICTFVTMVSVFRGRRSVLVRYTLQRY